MSEVPLTMARSRELLSPGMRSIATQYNVVLTEHDIDILFENYGIFEKMQSSLYDEITRVVIYYCTYIDPAECNNYSVK